MRNNNQPATIKWSDKAKAEKEWENSEERDILKRLTSPPLKELLSQQFEDWLEEEELRESPHTFMKIPEQFLRAFWKT